MALPDLDALRLLVSVAELGSIGAAGRAAGISQQSASERLRGMEAQVGLVLVRRSTRGATLTDAGRLLVEWSADLLQRADQVEAALATLRGQRSRELHVAASMTTAEYLVPRWLVRLRALPSAAGRVAVTLRATNSEAVLAAVRAGEADLGFTEGPVDTEGLASAVIGHDELVLVASPDDPWARRRGALAPAEVAARPLTSREEGSGTRLAWTRALERGGAVPTPPEVELTTSAAVTAAVRAGGAPAFLSRWTVEHELAATTLVEVRTRDLDLRRPFTAVWLGGPRPPAGPVRDLLAIARAS